MSDWEFVTPLEKRKNYDDEVRVIAEKHGVDPDLAVAVHRREFNPKQWSSEAGARGPMQLMPGTAKDLGVNPDDIFQNIDGGVRYLKQQLINHNNNVPLALAAYNAGPESVRKHKGIPPYSETQEYVKNVIGTYRAFKGGRNSGVANAAVAPPKKANAVDEFEYLGPLSEGPSDELERVGPVESVAKLTGGQGEVPQVDSPNRLWALKNPEKQKELEAMSGLDRFTAGVGQGLNNTWLGLKQAGASLGENVIGSFPEGTTDRITQEGMAERDAFKPLRNYSQLARAGEVVGEAAPFLAVPGGVSGNALQRAIISGIVGGGIGASRFVGPDDSRMANALLGAATGSGASGALSALSKGGNAVAGNIPQTETMRLAEKWKIPLTLSETKTGASSPKDVLLERFPWIFGNKSFRARQLDASNQASKSLFADYVSTPSALADPTAPSVMTANKAFAGNLFDNVKGLVDQVPNQAIAPTATRQKALELLDRYPDIFKKLQDTQTERIVRDITSSTKDIPEKVVRDPSTGWPVTVPSQPKALTFEEAWTLRQGLGTLIGQARKQKANGAIGDNEFSQFKSLFGAVSDDMDKWADDIGQPEIANRFKAANDAYKQYVVKYDVLQRAYDKVTRDVGDKELFSPARFSNELNRIVGKDRYLQRFTEAERNEMAGLANILQVAKRGGQFKENPPTGNRWGPIGALTSLGGLSFAGAGAGGVAASGGAVAGTVLLAKFLTTTNSGKRLALAASKIEPTNPGMKVIMTQITKQLPKFAATEAASLAAEDAD